jgi:hypothetical protein
MKDVPIYATTVIDLCLKRPGRKPKDPPTIHVLGKLSDLMLGKDTPVKYDDPGNPVFTVQINQTDLPNTLVDLGAVINVMTTRTTKSKTNPHSIRIGRPIYGKAIRGIGRHNYCCRLLGIPSGLSSVKYTIQVGRSLVDSGKAMACHNKCLYKLQIWKHVDLKWYLKENLGPLSSCKARPCGIDWDILHCLQ